MPDRDGPKLVTPEPYYTCEGCPMLHKEHNGWGFPLLTCVAGANPRRISSRSVIVTPEWCPLLPASKIGDENGTE